MLTDFVTFLSAQGGSLLMLLGFLCVCVFFIGFCKLSCAFESEIKIP